MQPMIPECKNVSRYDSRCWCCIIRFARENVENREKREKSRKSMIGENKKESSFLNLQLLYKNVIIRNYS